MEIENSTIWNEVDQVVNQTTQTRYRYIAQIVANGVTYPSLKVIESSVVRDYVNAYTDHTTIRLLLLQGVFYTYIYPYMDALEIILFKYPIAEVSDSADTTQVLETETYIATLASADTGSPYLQHNGMNTPSQQTLDLSDILDVEFQLVNRSIAQLRMSEVGQIFRNVTNQQVILSMLTTASQQVVVDNTRLIQGVSMVDANNTATRDHVIIPQGVGVLDVPQYIHEKCGGVYAAGFGYYLQGNYWYVYPCYDPTRVNTTTGTITLINIPANKLPGIERTYRQNGDNLVILATGETKFSDKTNAAQLNQGNGARWADATQFMTTMGVTSNNKTILSRADTNSEVLGVARANGYNNAKRSTTTANPYLEYSKLAQRQGSIFGMTWQNSNPALITPGRMVQVMYLDGENVTTVPGVILQCSHHIRADGVGANITRHITDSGIAVFVKRPIGNGDSESNQTTTTT